ncbi:hypothetical protein I3A86_25200, partial [Salmonella enterica]|nr:hypothetical protein [Salmonella enterica]
LEDSWARLKKRSTKAFEQRFTPPAEVQLRGMNDRKAVTGLIAGRLASAYAEVGYAPKYPTWPFSPAAINAAATQGLMPRILLMRCDAFRRACLVRQRIEECTSLVDETTLQPDHFIDDEEDFGLAAARIKVKIPEATAVEDAPLGRVLRDAFDLYALETPPREATDVASRGEPDQRIPPLHGRLTFTYHAENDRERHV